MQYVADPTRLGSAPHLAVASRPSPGAARTVSNLPGAPPSVTPHADTTVEMVLALLGSERGRQRLDGLEFVSSDHFDADSLLGVWAVLNPDQALARSAAVEAAARAGIFGVARTTAAAQFACWVASIVGEKCLTDPAEAMEYALPRVAEVLDDPRSHDLDWIGEYSDVINANAMLHSGAVEIEEYDDLDLAVMATPIWLHDVTRFSAMRGFRVLTVLTENHYTVEYRAESWVQYRSRTPAPRVDLRPLAARLNLFERNPGVWRATATDARNARLYLDNGSGRIAPSSIDAETVTAETLDFFRDASRRIDLHWSPYPSRKTL